MDILEAVRKLRPGTAWNLRGNILEQAEDGTPRVAHPTSDEIQAVILAEAYKESRKVEYPSLEDQLDAIWKGEPHLTEMRSRILEVKQKYPKP